MAQQTYCPCFLMHHVTKAHYLSLHGQSSAKQCCLALGVAGLWSQLSTVLVILVLSLAHFDSSDSLP